MLASVSVPAHMSLSLWDGMKGRESVSMCVAWPHCRECPPFCVLAVDRFFVKSPVSGLERSTSSLHRLPPEIHCIVASPGLASLLGLMKPQESGSSPFKPQLSR